MGEHVNAEQVMLDVLTVALGNKGGWMREQLVNYCPVNYCQMLRQTQTSKLLIQLYSFLFKCCLCERAQTSAVGNRDLECTMRTIFFFQMYLVFKNFSVFPKVLVEMLLGEECSDLLIV